jgi:uncharacterized protein YndB with AHSA1/START domain
MQTHSSSRVIAAAPETIFRAFSSAEAVASWRPPQGMACKVYAFDARQGGSFRMAFEYAGPEHDVPGKTSAHRDVFHGRFLEWVPNQRIVERVEFETHDPAFAGAMTITTTLAPAPEGTKVTILCENVPVGIRPADHEKGMTSTLENLAAFTERNANRQHPDH